MITQVKTISLFFIIVDKNYGYFLIVLLLFVECNKQRVKVRHTQKYIHKK